MKRNARNINKLADYIESGRQAFGMAHFKRRDRKTPVCILGQWYVKFGKETDCSDDFFRSLGVTRAKGVRLCFLPRDRSGCSLRYHAINRRMAVCALRRLARTGEVWFDPKEARAPRRPRKGAKSCA